MYQLKIENNIIIESYMKVTVFQIHIDPYKLNSKINLSLWIRGCVNGECGNHINILYFVIKPRKKIKLSCFDHKLHASLIFVMELGHNGIF